MVFPVWIPFESEWTTFAIFLLSIFGLVGLSEITLKREIISPESNRKLVHFLVGISVSISPLIFTSSIPPLTLSALFILVNALALKRGSFQGIHSQNRISYGTVYFPVSTFVIFLCFWNFPEFIIISLIILSISDPLASQVGQSTPGPSKFKIWNDEKTIQGTIAFFMSTFLIVYFGSQTFFDNSNNYLFGLALFTAIGATLAEVTSSKGTDNLSIPLVSILFMIGYFRHVSELGIFFDLTISSSSIFLFLTILLFSVAYQLHSLSRSGYYGGLILGTLITIIGSWKLLIPMAVFFILSSVLSKVIKNTSFYRSKGSRRDIVQVYANGGVALIICIHGYLNPNALNIFLFFASVSAAMADTWATEIGKLSKHQPRSIIGFESMAHGLSGGITRIDTVGSLLGACIIGLTVWTILPMPGFIIYGIIFCGFFASIFDSVLGATVQAKYETQKGEIIEHPEEGATLISGNRWINNDMVNLLNTAFAPFLMYFYLKLF